VFDSVDQAFISLIMEIAPIRTTDEDTGVNTNGIEGRCNEGLRRAKISFAIYLVLGLTLLVEQGNRGDARLHREHYVRSGVIYSDPPELDITIRTLVTINDVGFPFGTPDK